jgi:glycosyltransferase involved in cell wall biosynthesis
MSPRLGPHSFLVLSPDEELAADDHEYCKSLTCPVTASVTLRELWASVAIRSHGGVDVVLTPFGTPLTLVRKTPQVVGVAYSNLFVPEVDFWEKSGPLARARRRIRDRARLKALGNAVGWFLETEYLADRARRILDVASDSVAVIPPSVNPHPVHDGRIDTSSEDFSIALVSGAHPNKNLDVIPRLARELASRWPDSRIRFKITVDETTPSGAELGTQVAQAGVRDRVSLIGPVTPSALPSLYESVDAVAMLSTLESFSNNIIEAWHFRRPLVAADFEWAQRICGDAAAYLSVEDLSAAAAVLRRLECDSEWRRSLILAGRERLRSFPTAAERLETILDFTERLLASQ